MKAAAIAAVAPATARSLLVVDPDQGVLRSLGRILGRRRIWVEPALSCEQALELMGGVHFDAIAVDFGAPTQGGLWLLGQVRNTFPQVRRILTGKARLASVQPHLREGLIDGFVQKPFDVDELVGALAM